MLQKNAQQKTYVVFNVQNAGEPGKRDQESGNNAVASKDDEKDSSAPQTNQRVATVRFDINCHPSLLLFLTGSSSPGSSSSRLRPQSRPRSPSLRLPVHIAKIR